MATRREAARGPLSPHLPHLLLLLLVLVASSAPRPSGAYPSLFVSQEANTAADCLNHPSKGFGGHGPPTPDAGIAFKVESAETAGQQVQQVCPGGSYVARVSFPEPRQALLTASWGRLGAGADKTCPNRVVTSTPAGPQPGLTFPWQVSCKASGTAQLRVTSAKGSSAPFRQASADLPVAPAAAPECEAYAAACGAGGDAAAAQKGAALLPAAAPPASASASTSSAGGGCKPSPLGYQCMTDLDTETGVKLHYSQGSAAPPVNACTRDAPATGPAAAAASALPAEMMHFAVEAPTDGYVALGFPREAGVMSPSDAVIGWVEAGNGGAGDGGGQAGRADADAYRLDSGYRVSRSNAARDWATRINSARVPSSSSPGATATVTCFSRPQRTAAAAYSPSVDPAAAKINWAVSRRPGLVTHARAGGMVMDLKRGAATGASALTSAAGDGGGGAGGGGLFAGGAGDSLGGLSPALAAHGLLGLLAFALLMPAGVVLSRHKWLFSPAKAAKEGQQSNAAAGGGRHLGCGWFLSHVSVQALALACALAALLTALLGVGWDRTPPSRAYEAHRAVGIAAVGLALLQATLGAVFRPRDVAADERAADAAAAAAAGNGALKDGGGGGGGGGGGLLATHHGHGHASADLVRARKRRTAWVHGHRTGGWLVLLAGWAAVFLGCWLMVSVRGAAPAWWFAPAGALCGAFLLLMLALEAFKRQMQLTGRYDPRTRVVRRGRDLMTPPASAGGAAAAAAAQRRSGGGGIGGGGIGGGGANGYYPVPAAAAANGSSAGGGAGYHSAGGAASLGGASSAYHTAGGGASSAGGGSAGGGGGGDVYPDIRLGGEGVVGGGSAAGGGAFLPPPPAI